MQQTTAKMIKDQSDRLAYHIMAWYDQANDLQHAIGNAWYPIAGKIADICRSGTRYSLLESMAIMAILSPQLDWIGNIDETYNTIQAIDFRSRQTGSNRYKAQAIMSRSESPANVVSGFKVSAFYDNIRFPGTSTRVTLDRHMLKCLVLVPGYHDNKFIPYTDAMLQKYINTAKKYRVVSDIFLQLADSYRVPVATLQAVCWMHYRESTGMIDTRDKSTTIASELWFDMIDIVKQGGKIDL